MNKVWYFPDFGFEYTRTPDFIAERFGVRVEEPYMEFQARTPGEAVLKFQRYVEIGRQVGAYQ